MESSNSELIDKWGFWLVMYTLASTIFLMLLSAVLSYPWTPIAILILLTIQLPCFLGGVLYLYFGAKFRSAIFLSVGVLALLALMISNIYRHIPILSFYLNDKKIYLLIVFVSFILLIVRLRKRSLGKVNEVEKWGIWLASFAIVAPFLACCVYLSLRLFPGVSIRLFPVVELGFMISCIVGGIIYLFLGAKQRSFKYASLGLAAPLLGYLHLVLLLVVLSWSFMN